MEGSSLWLCVEAVDEGERRVPAPVSFDWPLGCAQNASDHVRGNQTAGEESNERTAHSHGRIHPF